MSTALAPDFTSGTSTDRLRTGAPIALVLCSMMSLQIGAALSTRLFPLVGAAGASTLRLGLAALLLLAVTRPALRSWTRQQWSAVILLGLALAGMNGLFYEAIARVPIGIAITVEFLGPLGLAAALSRRPRDVVWVLMALGGVAVLGMPSASGPAVDGVGLLVAAGAGVFWAAYIVTGSRLATAGIGAGGLAVSTGVSALIIAPFGIATGGAALLHADVLWRGALVAVLASAIPYSCEIAALARLPKRTFSVLVALEPAVGALAGALILGQQLSLVGGAAIGGVVAAAIGSTWSSTRAAPAPGDLGC